VGGSAHDHAISEIIFSNGHEERDSRRFSAKTLVTFAASFTINSATEVDGKKLL
jgi:hypothetical protein